MDIQLTLPHAAEGEFQLIEGVLSMRPKFYKGIQSQLLFLVTTTSDVGTVRRQRVKVNGANGRIFVSELSRRS
ncbi:unnamed protein product [marine sediment metagenome]|uniref:Uncharacterized protein n=1 Tax=marine sediment metagenome TaxID=412755 RepID=X1AM78_9ZZZZ